MKLRKTLVIAAAVFCAALSRCTSLNDLAGATDMPNEGKTIIATVYDPAGNPAAFATVRLREASYLQGIAAGSARPHARYRNTVTDEAGCFVIDSLDTGAYSIEINDGNKMALRIRCAVAGKPKAIALPDDTLRPAGTITGLIGPLAAGDSACVQVYGLERMLVADQSTGAFACSDIPAGACTFRITSVSSLYKPMLFDTIVPSGRAVELGSLLLRSPANEDLSKWAHAQTIACNTTAAGAGVSETLPGFPLLVRLNTSNFTFSEALPDGRDVRFCKPDGTRFPHEIEQWDPAAGSAAIWVLVDTIWGNAETPLKMQWGAQGALARSQGGAVFSAGNGFGGVWHLGENAPATAVKDAVGRNDGTMRSGTGAINTSTVSAKGLIGRSLDLQGGLKQWVDLGADKAFVNGRREVALSVWMNPATDTAVAMEMLNFSAGGTLNAIEPESRASLAAWYEYLVFMGRSLDSDQVQRIQTASAFATGQWQLYTGVIKVPQDSMYVYVNGVLRDAAAVTFGGQATDVTNSTHSAIGANDLGLEGYFYGRLDEARLEFSARSPGWLKLTYESQKPGSGAVLFK